MDTYSYELSECCTIVYRINNETGEKIIVKQPVVVETTPPLPPVLDIDPSLRRGRGQRPRQIVSDPVKFKKPKKQKPKVVEVDIDPTVRRGRGQRPRPNVEPFLKRTNKPHKIKYTPRENKISIKKQYEPKGELLDFIIGISSFNRYEKVVSILDSLFSQPTKAKFKVIILNDGSKDERYKELNLIKDVVVINNKNNFGKFKYWLSITKLFQESTNYNYKYFIQVDDDFKLRDNFLNKILEHHKKGEVVYYHRHDNSTEKRWGVKCWVDGGTSYSKEFLEKIDFKIPKIPMKRWILRPELSSGVWTYISHQLNLLNIKVIKPETLVFHQGNYDSKMNTEIRKHKKINTKINNVYVSFTSIPDRFDNLENIYNQLKNQTYKPDKVYLYIPYKYRRSIKPIVLPKFLLNQDLIEVKRCWDIGPITKIYYSLLNKDIKQNDIIISIDDDMNINNTFIEKLVNESHKKPNACIAYRGRSFANNDLIYNHSKVVKGNLSSPIEVDLALGVDGVLYKKKFFKDDFFDIHLNEVEYVDDIWINGNLAKNKIKRYVISNLNISPSTYVDVNSLYSINKTADYNNNVINYFKKYFIK